MILLVSLFGSINTNNSRISNIFHYTSNLAINVVTSDFNHGSKRYKECIDNITTVQRNYPIGSVDLNRNHSSDVLV